MIYLIGRGRKLKTDIWAGEMQCPNCGKVSHFHLKRLVAVGYMFFIPFISATEKRFLSCDSCQCCLEVNRREYKKRLKEQKKKLQNNQFPSDVIKKDYSPKSLKMWLKYILLLLTLAFAVIMIIGGVSMMMEGGIGNIIVSLLIMVFVGIMPFLLTLKSFLKAKEKQNIYNKHR